ncbi:hypothetical protein [Halostella salina]|uniref:hypothetical protein n=1 Tax=Halostella salina TaxID=1547897 RepID=UPI000EF76F9B|nr:hypothetical protein [Halostella salina]
MGALTDAIVDALTEFVSLLFSPITSLIETYVDDLVRTVVGTPHPNAVFAEPSNGVWPGMYEYYWEAIVPLSLMLWALSIGIVILLETTSHLFGGYHRAKLKRRAFSGLLGVLAWWWLAAISLRFVSALTGFLVPDLSEVSLFQTLSFGALGVLGLAITLTVDLTLFLLLALIYYVRQVVLYMFVLLMPILIVLWIPGVGPFALVSRFMRRLAGFYVPFLFMTVPVAILFRLGEILGGGLDLTMGGLGAWLSALVIPIVAVAAPIVLFWQAGALFFAADRASHRTSTSRARDRVGRTSAGGQRVAQGGRNFTRGARGEPAVDGAGQTTLGSTGSRAHAMGSRVHSTRVGLNDTFGGSNGQTGAAGNRDDVAESQPAQSDGSPPALPGRTDGVNPIQDRRDGGSAGGERANSADDHERSGSAPSERGDHPAETTREENQ